VGALYLGVAHLLPAYNEQFSVRGQLARHAPLTPASRPVVCYPQRFDSVGFYLPEREVAVFTHSERGQLAAHLEASPGSLVLVKGGKALDELLASLPPTVRFLTANRTAAIVVGRTVGVGPEPVRGVAAARRR
jgi:hypothetical protein